MYSGDPWRDARRRAKGNMAMGYYIFAGFCFFAYIHASGNRALILLVDIPIGIFIVWKIYKWHKKEEEKKQREKHKQEIKGIILESLKENPYDDETRTKLLQEFFYEEQIKLFVEFYPMLNPQQRYTLFNELDVLARDTIAIHIMKEQMTK